MATNDTNEPNVPRDLSATDETTRRGVYISEDTWRAAKSYAAAQGMTVSKLFELAVTQFIGPQKPHVSARDVIGTTKKHPK